MKFKPEKKHKLVHSSDWVDGLLEIYLTTGFEYIFVWEINNVEFLRC